MNRKLVKIERNPLHAFSVLLAAIFLFAFPPPAPGEDFTMPSGDALFAFERELEACGFVDVQALDPTIRVELKYAAEENFMGVSVYGEFNRAYLRLEAAQKLVRANALLHELLPGHTLLVVDAFRPRRVQRKMWDSLNAEPLKKLYVADPAGGSMHNYGCAVDVTISDSQGNRLDMGTPIDHFGVLAQPRLEKSFLKKGKLTAEQVANRRLLRSVMAAAGFRPLPIEWWHFDAFEKSHVRKVYAIVE
jgi:zinc D-Ala-D-Ala dipeptidase